MLLSCRAGAHECFRFVLYSITSFSRLAKSDLSRLVSVSLALKEGSEVDSKKGSEALKSINTGRFLISEVQHQVGAGHQQPRVSAVRAKCGACNAEFTASAEGSLTPIYGGAVLSCPGCGQRQALGQSVFG